MTKEKEIFIRNDCRISSMWVELCGRVRDAINDYAIPVFNEFGIEVSMENVKRYCTVGGIDRMKEDFTPKETSLLAATVRAHVISVMKNSPKFPQFADPNEVKSLSCLFLSTKQVPALDSAGNEIWDKINGSFKKQTVLAFEVNDDEVRKNSEIFISGDFVSEYRKHVEICDAINNFLGKPSLSLWRSAFCIETGTGRIIPNSSIISNEFYKKLQENRNK